MFQIFSLHCFNFYYTWKRCTSKESFYIFFILNSYKKSALPLDTELLPFIYRLHFLIYFLLSGFSSQIHLSSPANYFCSISDLATVPCRPRDSLHFHGLWNMCVYGMQKISSVFIIVHFHCFLWRDLLRSGIAVWLFLICQHHLSLYLYTLNKCYPIAMKCNSQLYFCHANDKNFLASDPKY